MFEIDFNSDLKEEPYLKSRCYTWTGWQFQDPEDFWIPM